MKLNPTDFIHTQSSHQTEQQPVKEKKKKEKKKPAIRTPQVCVQNALTVLPRGVAPVVDYAPPISESHVHPVLSVLRILTISTRHSRRMD